MRETQSDWMPEPKEKPAQPAGLFWFIWLLHTYLTTAGVEGSWKWMKGGELGGTIRFLFATENADPRASNQPPVAVADGTSSFGIVEEQIGFHFCSPTRIRSLQRTSVTQD